MRYGDIINKYKVRILSANNKDLETEKVIQEITNNSTILGVHLTDSDKADILNCLLEELQRHSFENFSLDNKEYLTLIDKAIKLVSEKQE